MCGAMLGVGLAVECVSEGDLELSEKNCLPSGLRKGRDGDLLARGLFSSQGQILSRNLVMSCHPVKVHREFSS